MTYVRSKNIKGHTYYYEVRSVREGDKVRQEYVRYLGKTAPGANKSELGTTRKIEDYGPKDEPRQKSRKDKASSKWSPERKRRAKIVSNQTGATLNESDKLIQRAENSGVAWDKVDWDALQGEDLTYSERVKKLDQQVGHETRTRTEQKRAEKRNQRSYARAESLSKKEELSEDEKAETEAAAYEAYLDMKSEGYA